MNYQELLQKVEEQVMVFYRDQSDENLFYHKRSRTRELLETVKRLADHYQLDDRSFFIVYAAASFLYSGFYQAGGESNENKSAELAGMFLQLKGVDSNLIEEIKKCILSTGPSQTPTTLPEQILCDADTYYFGTSSFDEKVKLLRKEKEFLGAAKISGTTWRSSLINTLETHRYHTDLCRLLLDPTKAWNLATLQNLQETKKEEKINKAKAAAEKEALKKERAEAAIANPVQEEKLPKENKKVKEIKGVESLYRTNSTNNIRMSIMADRKAHIMLSVNSIIISVTLGLVIKNLDENRHLLIPALLILTVSVVSIIYAILATRPKMHPGTFTREQLEKKSVNMFFFGSFFNMPFEDYEKGMQAMLNDRQFMYRNFAQDIYWQGKVLGRKYRFLNICYTVFMYGVILSVLAFTIATISHK